MAKILGWSTLIWWGGVAICAILTSFFIRAKGDTSALYMWTFAGLFSISGYIIAIVLKIKKFEIDELKELITNKACQTDIRRIECQITTINEGLNRNAEAIEEMHTTINSNNATMIALLGKLVNK